MLLFHLPFCISRWRIIGHSFTAVFFYGSPANLYLRYLPSNKLNLSYGHGWLSCPWYPGHAFIKEPFMYIHPSRAKHLSYQQWNMFYLNPWLPRAICCCYPSNSSFLFIGISVYWNTKNLWYMVFMVIYSIYGKLWFLYLGLIKYILSFLILSCFFRSNHD